MGARLSKGGKGGGAARDTEVPAGVMDEIAKLEGEVKDREKRLAALHVQVAMVTRGAPKDVEKFFFNVLKDVEKGTSLAALGDKYGSTTELLLANVNKRLATDDKKMAFAKAMQAAADMYDINLSGGPGMIRRVSGALLSGLITVALLMLVVAFALQISKMDLRPMSGAGYTTVDVLRLFDAMFPNSGRNRSKDLIYYMEAMASGVLRDVINIGSKALSSGGGRNHRGQGRGPHPASDALQVNPLVVFALNVAAARKPAVGTMGGGGMDGGAMDDDGAYTD